jgi:hypothetical protein
VAGKSISHHHHHHHHHSVWQGEDAGGAYGNIGDALSDVVGVQRYRDTGNGLSDGVYIFGRPQGI